jgi:hypothetical protein
MKEKQGSDPRAANAQTQPAKVTPFAGGNEAAV